MALSFSVSLAQPISEFNDARKAAFLTATSEALEIEEALVDLSTSIGAELNAEVRVYAKGFSGYGAASLAALKITNYKYTDKLNAADLHLTSLSEPQILLESESMMGAERSEEGSLVDDLKNIETAKAEGRLTEEEYTSARAAALRQYRIVVKNPIVVKDSHHHTSLKSAALAVIASRRTPYQVSRHTSSSASAHLNSVANLAGAGDGAGSSTRVREARVFCVFCGEEKGRGG